MRNQNMACSAEERAPCEGAKVAGFVAAERSSTNSARSPSTRSTRSATMPCECSSNTLGAAYPPARPPVLAVAVQRLFAGGGFTPLCPHAARSTGIPRPNCALTSGRTHLQLLARTSSSPAPPATSVSASSDRARVCNSQPRNLPLTGWALLLAHRLAHCPVLLALGRVQRRHHRQVSACNARRGLYPCRQPPPPD